MTKLSELQFIPSKVDDEQLVVISDGVYEGECVEGVRYVSPDHMSGWWLTTESFDGDTNKLKTVHVKHLIDSRPDLIKFLDLPEGYRFYQKGYKKFDEDVWFDQSVYSDDNWG